MSPIQEALIEPLHPTWPARPGALCPGGLGFIGGKHDGHRAKEAMHEAMSWTTERVVRLARALGQETDMGRYTAHGVAGRLADFVRFARRRGWSTATVRENVLDHRNFRRMSLLRATEPLVMDAWRVASPVEDDAQVRTLIQGVVHHWSALLVSRAAGHSEVDTPMGPVSTAAQADYSAATALEGRYLPEVAAELRAAAVELAETELESGPLALDKRAPAVLALDGATRGLLGLGQDQFRTVEPIDPSLYLLALELSHRADPGLPRATAEATAAAVDKRWSAPGLLQPAFAARLGELLFRRGLVLPAEAGGLDALVASARDWLDHGSTGAVIELPGQRVPVHGPLATPTMPWWAWAAAGVAVFALIRR